MPVNQAETSSSLLAAQTNACQRHRYTLPDPNLDLDLKPRLKISYCGREKNAASCCVRLNEGTHPGFEALDSSSHQAGLFVVLPGKKSSCLEAKVLLPPSFPLGESMCDGCSPGVHVTEEAAQGLIIQAFL